ncbi:unnamed protein product, partial [Ceratitis capitata]
SVEVRKSHCTKYQESLIALFMFDDYEARVIDVCTMFILSNNSLSSQYYNKYSLPKDLIFCCWDLSHWKLSYLCDTVTVPSEVYQQADVQFEQLVCSNSGQWTWSRSRSRFQSRYPTDLTSQHELHVSKEAAKKKKKVMPISIFTAMDNDLSHYFLEDKNALQYYNQ